MEGSALRDERGKKLSAPENTSSTPVHPELDEQGRGDAITRRHAAEHERLLDVVDIALPRRYARGLLRGVVEQPSHLLGVESDGAAGGGGRTESAGELCVLLCASVCTAGRRAPSSSAVRCRSRALPRADTAGVDPACSPTASAAGTTAHPGCDSDGACESSVSSECASTPLTSAASIGPTEEWSAATVAPPRAQGSSRNAWRRDQVAGPAPEIMAAIVSRMWYFDLLHDGRGQGAARGCAHVAAEPCHHGAWLRRCHRRQRTHGGQSCERQTGPLEDLASADQSVHVLTCPVMIAERGGSPANDPGIQEGHAGAGARPAPARHDVENVTSRSARRRSR